MSDPTSTLRELCDLTAALATQVNRLAVVVTDVNDDLTALAIRHRTDVEALRESLRATDRVLNNRTAHLA